MGTSMRYNLEQGRSTQCLIPLFDSIHFPFLQAASINELKQYHEQEIKSLKNEIESANKNAEANLESYNKTQSQAKDELQKTKDDLIQRQAELQQLKVRADLNYFY